MILGHDGSQGASEGAGGEGATVGLSAQHEAPGSHGDARIDQADASTWLSRILSGSVDLIVTDPPYASLDKHRSVGTTTRLNDWFPTISDDALVALVPEFFRVLRADRHCYVFCDWTTALILESAARDAGFMRWVPIVWDRDRTGMGYHYRSRYELILFWEKGSRQLESRTETNIQRFKAPRGGYPTRKPQALVELLIRQSAPFGDGRQCELFGKNRPLVVDPFVGSGTTAAAALACDCDFAGCDVSEAAVSMARIRVGDQHVRS